MAKHYISMQGLRDLLPDGKIGPSNFGSKDGKPHKGPFFFYENIAVRVYRLSGYIKASIYSKGYDGNLEPNVPFIESISNFTPALLKLFVQNAGRFDFGLNEQGKVHDGLELAVKVLAELPGCPVERDTDIVIHYDDVSEHGWPRFRLVLQTLCKMDPAGELRHVIFRVDKYVGVPIAHQRGFATLVISGMIGFKITSCLYESQQRRPRGANAKAITPVNSQCRAFCNFARKKLRTLGAIFGPQTRHLSWLPDELMLQIFERLVVIDPGLLTFGARLSPAEMERTSLCGAETMSIYFTASDEKFGDQDGFSIFQIDRRTRRIAAELAHKHWHVKITQRTMRQNWAEHCRQIQCVLGCGLLTCAKTVLATVELENDLLAENRKHNPEDTFEISHRGGNTSNDEDLTTMHLLHESKNEIAKLLKLLDYRFSHLIPSQLSTVEVQNSASTSELAAPRSELVRLHCGWKIIPHDPKRSQDRHYNGFNIIGPVTFVEMPRPQIWLQLAIGCVRLDLRVTTRVNYSLKYSNNYDKDNISIIAKLYIEEVREHLVRRVQCFAREHDMIVDVSELV